MYVFLAVIVIGIAAFIFYCEVLAKKARKIIAEKEEKIRSFCPNARIVVNITTYTFFVDDENDNFGIDTSGKMYRLSGIRSVFSEDNKVSISHDDLKKSIEFGSHGSINKSISFENARKIEKEVLIHLHKRMDSLLKEKGLASTHEYVHQGTIWGCDVNSGYFYTTYGSPDVIPFYALKRVTIENAANKPLIDGNYLINVEVEDTPESVGFIYDLIFKEKNATFYNLLEMFKGIRNRQKQYAKPSIGAYVQTRLYKGQRSCSQVLEEMNCLLEQYERRSNFEILKFLPMYLSAVAKYVTDRAAADRKEKAKIYDICIAVLDRGPGFEIDGQMIYLDTHDEDGVSVIGTLDEMILSYPKTAVDISGENEADFLMLCIELVSALESSVRGVFPDISFQPAADIYARELKEHLG